MDSDIPGDRPRRPWWRLASYRGRCLALLLALVAALLLVAALGHRHLATIGNEAAQAMARHHRAVAGIDDSIAALHRLRHQLFVRAIASSPRSSDRLDAAYAAFDAALRDVAAVQTAAGDARVAATLSRHRASLDDAIDSLFGSAAKRDGLTPEAIEGWLDGPLGQLQRDLQTLRAALAADALQRSRELAAAGLSAADLLAFALLATALLVLAGYLGFDHLVLRPLRTLADALRTNARHPLVPRGRVTAVTETHDLLDAFATLQQEIRAREQALDHLARHDPLTGLPNRNLFRSRLAGAIAEARRHGMLVGVLFMDLNRFKQINDSYGHAAGDRMLVEIGDRLKRIFRAEDTVARLGGDEFAILLEGLHDRAEMTRLAHKTLAAVQRPFAVGDRVFHRGAALGIAVAPDDGSDPDQLIQLADAAMYAAKEDGGAGFRYVDAALNRHAAAQHRLENELRTAIDTQQLQLYYQPITAVADGRLHCYESLLRWPHEQYGVLTPDAFMDLLADAGLCRSVTDWVLDELADRPAADVAVSFNLSARLLQDATFAERILARIDDVLPADRLIIEITEDTLTSDLDAAARVLHRLKSRGVRVALDDFGTGQASLSHLRRFPFDYLKIDRSFVAGIGVVGDDEKLIQAVIGLAHALGIGVVAEGIETEAQRDFLVAHGCDYLQGYLIGPPTAHGRYPAATA